MQEKLISRKVVLSLAGVLAAAAFAPEASALPAFARQVGRACSACHQQHFPVLNAYGRDFKASGYTMMGSQKKIKDEHLSIPDTLNAAVLLKVRYDHRSGVAGGTLNGAGTTQGTGQWQFGDEASLFFGGRVAENIGFMLEGNIANHAAAATAAVPAACVPVAPATTCAAPVTNNGGTGGLMAGLKVPFIYNVGDFKLGVVPFTTDALGVSYGYELSSAGVMRANRWAEQRRDSSAIQYALSDGAGSAYLGAASGLSFVAKNDLGYINITRWSPNAAPGANGGAMPSFDFKSNYVRIAATPTIGDWALVGGIGFMSGTSEAGVTSGVMPVPGVANSGLFQTRGSFADLQAHGLLAGNDLGIYLTYANAPASSALCVAGANTSVMGGDCNLYNTGTLARSAWAIGADYSVIPHILHLGAAYRAGKAGVANAVTLANQTDNAFLVQGIYDLAQNVALHAMYTTRSGTAYNATAAGGNNGKNKNEYMFMLEGSW